MRENLNRPITRKETELLVKSFHTNTKKTPGLDDFTGEFYQAFKELIPAIHKLFQRNKREHSPCILYYPIRRQDITRTENCRPSSLMSINAKLNKILIQQHIKRVKHHDSMGFIPVYTWFNT